MTALVLWVAMAAAVTAEEPLSYNDAYEAATKTKKPMLILVSAEWCPACRSMKQTTLPELQKSGKLSGVTFTIVDVDASPRLSSQLMRSTTIPQLIFFAPLSDGWKRDYLIGSQAPEQIVEMVRTGLAEQQRNLAASQSAPAAGKPATGQTAGE